MSPGNRFIDGVIEHYREEEAKEEAARQAAAWAKLSIAEREEHHRVRGCPTCCILPKASPTPDLTQEHVGGYRATPMALASRLPFWKRAWVWLWRKG
jgi:hypothetical protein